MINMLNDYVPGEYTQTEADAVALLMRDIGIAVNMEYGPNESGAYSQDVVGALVNNFGYSRTTEMHERSTYRTEEWINLIKHELLSNRPVYYSGGDAQGAGHAFVCDGIDSNNYLHINWGWGGYCDGYFDMNYMNPDGLGIGGGTGSYVYNQAVITGIQPAGEDENSINTEKLMLYGGFSYDNEIFSRQSVTLYLNDIYNVSPYTFNDVLIGIALCKNDEVYYTHAVQINDELPPNYGSKKMKWDFMIPDTCADGNYELRCLVAQPNRASWREVDFPVNVAGRIGLSLDGDKVTLSMPDLYNSLCLENGVKVSASKVSTGESVKFDFTVKNVGDVHNKGYIRMLLFSDSEAVYYVVGAAVDAMIYQGTSIDFSLNVTMGNLPTGKYRAIPWYYELDESGNITNEILLSAIQDGTEVEIYNIVNDRISIFKETFTNGIPSTFTLIDNDNLEPSQAAKELGFAKGIAWLRLKYGDEPLAVSHSSYEPAGQSDDWLITPAILIPEKEYDVLLGWKSLDPDGGSYKVLLSTKGNTLDSFRDAVTLASFSELKSSFGQHYVDLNAYKGQTVYIAFVNDGIDCSFLGIDDIELFLNTPLIYPAIENLNGTVNRDKVTLTWDKPQFTDISVAEDQLLGYNVYRNRENINMVSLWSREDILGSYSGWFEGNWNPVVKEISKDSLLLENFVEVMDSVTMMKHTYAVTAIQVGYLLVIPSQIICDSLAVVGVEDNGIIPIRAVLTKEGMTFLDYWGIARVSGNSVIGWRSGLYKGLTLTYTGERTLPASYSYVDEALYPGFYDYYIEAVYENNLTASQSIPMEVHFLKGDANNDGRINVADIVYVINHIMGKTPEEFNAENSDINADSTIDISDVQGIVSIILGRELPAEVIHYGSYRMANNTLTVSAPVNVAGFDFAYTGELSATEVLKDFKVTYYEKGGEKRVLAYTMGEGLEVLEEASLFATNGSIISDMKFVDAYGNEIRMDAAPTNLSKEDVTMLNLKVENRVLSVETDVNVSSITLFNAAGVQVAETRGTEISLDALPNGTYVVVVKTDSNIIRRKINL